MNWFDAEFDITIIHIYEKDKNWLIYKIAVMIITWFQDIMTSSSGKEISPVGWL